MLLTASQMSSAVEQGRSHITWHPALHMHSATKHRMLLEQKLFNRLRWDSLEGARMATHAYKTRSRTRSFSSRRQQACYTEKDSEGSELEDEDFLQSSNVRSSAIRSSRPSSVKVYDSQRLRQKVKPLPSTSQSRSSSNRHDSSMPIYSVRHRSLHEEYDNELSPRCSFRFRALSQNLFGDQDNHAILRMQIMDHMKKYSDHYQDFAADEAFQQYLKRMSHDGAWGDNLTLQAASDMLGRTVIVFTDQPGLECLEITPWPDFQCKPELPPFYLLFWSEVHYDAAYLSTESQD